jgi:hypothetical protein
MPRQAKQLTARDIVTVVQIAKGEKPRHDGALKKGIAKLYDGAGLFVEAAPNGSTFWRLKHSGGNKIDTLGRYPQMSLKDAREAAIDSRRKIADGINPAEERRDDAVNTFQIKAEKWLEEQTKLGKLEPGTIRRHQSRLKTFVYPKLGSRPIDEITGPELLQVLNKVCDQDKAHTAERIRQLFSQIVKKKVPHIPDVAASIKGQIDIPEGGHLPGITDPTKFAAILRAIEGYDGTYPTKVALKLSAMLFTRPGELRKMEWTERGGLGISDRSISGMTAIFFHNSRSDSDETTETQPLAGLQGESGFGSLDRREDDRAACCAL